MARLVGPLGPRRRRHHERSQQHVRPRRTVRHQLIDDGTPQGTAASGLKYVHHLYGDRSSTSRNGEYHFEWTPFTPAVLAWQSAERYLTQARNHLSEVSDLKSFAIPGLDVEFREFKAVLEVLIGDVEARAGEAKRVHQALDAANAEYAKANEFSHEETTG